MAWEDGYLEPLPGQTHGLYGMFGYPTGEEPKDFFLVKFERHLLMFGNVPKYVIEQIHMDLTSKIVRKYPEITDPKDSRVKKILDHLQMEYTDTNHAKVFEENMKRLKDAAKKYLEKKDEN